MSNATEMNRNPRAGVNARWGLCQRLRDGGVSCTRSAPRSRRRPRPMSQYVTRGFVLDASLCDLVQAVLIGNVPRKINAQQCSDQVAEAPQISIPAEPHPPLQPPVA